jgi:hypothetical protein
MFETLICYFLLVLAVVVCVLNWGCVIASYRLRRQGSKRHVSTIPLVAQILISLAVLVTPASSSVPLWLFWVVAFADPALYSILYLPLFLLRRKFSAKT